jgi:hypothetical protein
MSWLTLLTAGLCLLVLSLRFLAANPDGFRRIEKLDIKRGIKSARLLISAALALAAVGYILQRQAHNIDATGAYQPSLLERIVMTLSGK